MYCQCGCGQLAPIATRTSATYGYIKGQPKKYIRSHYNNGRPRLRIHKNKWEAALRNNYGIGLDEWDEMNRCQGGCCAICGLAKKLEVDHNHATGKVRGLLCRPCNHLVGYVDAGLAHIAINYVKDRDLA